MKFKIGAIVAAVIVLFLVGKFYNNYETNSRFKFKNEDIKDVWVFKGNQGLSYNYKIEDRVLNDIFKELNSKKKIQVSFDNVQSSSSHHGLLNYYKKIQVPSDILQFTNSQPISIFIVVDSPSEGFSGDMSIIEKDDTSVYVVSNKIGSQSKMLILESSYLSEYLKKLKVELDK